MTSPGLNKKRPVGPLQSTGTIRRNPRLTQPPIFLWNARQIRKNIQDWVSSFSLEWKRTRRAASDSLRCAQLCAMPSLEYLRAIRNSKLEQRHMNNYTIYVWYGHGRIHMFINIWIYHCPHHSLHQHCNALSIYTGCFFVLFTLKF